MRSPGAPARPLAPGPVEAFVAALRNGGTKLSQGTSLSKKRSAGWAIGPPRGWQSGEPRRSRRGFHCLLQDPEAFLRHTYLYGMASIVSRTDFAMQSQ